MCLQLVGVGALTWSAGRIAEKLGYRSWERAVASGVIALGLATGGVVFLGSFGWLSPGSLMGATAILVLLVARGSRARADEAKGESWLAPAMWIPLSLGVALAAPLGVRAFARVPLAWDALTYQLVRSARWLESGRIDTMDWPAPFDLVGFYPAGASALYAYLMGIAKADLLVSAASWFLVGLGALALMGIARRLGGSNAASLSAGLVYACLPIVLNLSASPWTEPLLNFGLFAGIWLSLRWMTNPPGSSMGSAVLVGLALGLACGSKYTALPVAAWVWVWLAFHFLRVEGAKRSAVLMAAVLGVALAIGGFWYLENLIHKGNPFYPLAVGPLPGAEVPPGFWGLALWRYLPAIWQAPGWTEAWLGSSRELWTLGHASWVVGGLALVGAVGLGAAGSGGVGLGSARLRGAGPGGAGPSDRRSEESSASREAAAFVLGAMLIAGATYLCIPTFTDPHIVKTSLRFAVPSLMLGSAAGLAVLSRLGVPDWAFASTVLAIQGLAFVHLDLGLPGLGPEASMGLVGGVFLVGVAASGNLIRIRARGFWAWLPAAAALVVLCGVFGHREDQRYAQYAHAHAETIPIQRYFAPVAQWLEESHPGSPLAVAASPKLDFLYLFVGAALDRRLVHVPMEGASPAERSGAGRRAWLQRLEASEAALLLVMRRPTEDGIEPEQSRGPGVQMPWPREARWARAGGLAEIYRDRFARVYRLGAPTPASGAGDRDRP